ncbi:HAMP domain-containing sensor histidine kinase [Ekhidna sp. MALMAid0563]|uniref:sensor histidine kinase n=1 Tax=Ekhidna sp. MALMAid0563 TaxID=3143937 RepID=UPI0032DECA90
MKNAHIRVLVILAILSLVGIIGTQVFWLNRAIAQQDQVFNHNVQVALRNVVESLCEANGKDFPSINPIEQVSGNYFIVRTNDKIDLTNLEYLISAEIKKRAITQDFEYGVYDCANNQMVYAENVNLEYAEDRDPIPVLKNDEYYFGVYFPEKSRNLFAGFDLWKFTTAISLVVIIFFGFALFVILRQKRLSEVQKDFINNVSHELKTPLATLTLASSTLNERTAEKDKKYVGIIQKEVGRLQKNVEDILHSALLDSDRKIQKESVDLGDFLERLIDDVREEYASSMIGWDLKLNGVSNLKSNQTLLENVLRNLIDNAVKYGAKNIEMKVSQDSKKTMISVIDDGVGIESKHHKKIFRKFYRIPEPNNQHNQKGFGLGLHIVSSLIRKLGGKIQLESEPGKGSTFKITLPNG